MTTEIKIIFKSKERKMLQELAKRFPPSALATKFKVKEATVDRWLAGKHTPPYFTRKQITLFYTRYKTSRAKSATIALILALTTLGSIGAARAEMDEYLAIRAAIGEASDQGYDGLLAVCVGIRNRGHLQGVYGLNAKHVDSEPEWVWTMARKAWTESEHNRVHTGDHWESTDFPTPKWSKDMVEVYRYKKHVFYKKREK